MSQNNTGPGKHPMSTPLMDSADHAGGIVVSGVTAGKKAHVVPSGGSQHGASMIDGPYGGKKPQG